MKVLRCRHPGQVAMLAAHIQNPDYQQERWVEVVQAWIEGNPEETLLLAAVEGDSVVGILLATAEPDVPHAFIHQAWADAKAGPEVTDQVFYLTCQWAEQMGKTQIRMETKRDPRGLQRRWLFQPIAQIMQFDIPASFEAFARRGRRPDSEEATTPAGTTEGGDDHGRQQRQQSQADEHTDSGPEEGR